VIAAMDSVYLQLMTSVPDGPCWRCVFPIADSTWDPLGFRVLGAVAGTVGCLAAVEVVKVLIGVDTALTGRLLYGDLWKMDFQTLSVRRSPTCPDCTR
jgi:molybdopterin/thiamine biosynthesis adenylyltransferase